MRVSSALSLALVVLAVGSCAVSGHFDKVHPMSRVKVANIAEQLTAGGTITIEATVLNGTGQLATVSWSNVGSAYPGNFDWIGVWSPKPDNWTTTTPAKYKFIIPDGTGSGSTELWFLNMRDSYTVAYFTGGLTKPVLLAVSEPVEFSNYHLPMQLHLAYTDDPTQMVVQWTTQQNMFPSLQFGTSANKLDNTVMRVNSSTYKASDLCGAPASAEGWRAPGFLHQALLTGLTPNTEYFYTVGDESSFSKSDVLSFFTAPVPSPETEVDFIIFGDLGQVETDGSNEASQMDGSIFTTVAIQQDLAEGIIAKNRSAAVFHIGDISYARGYATLWEQFFYQISNMSGSIPWMTCDGNHERDWLNSGSLFTGRDSGGECGVAYERRFRMPTSSLDNTWWSLNYGPVHFVVLSTEHAFAVGTPQYEWVAADLAAVNRSQTPFVVLTGHRPMYIDSTFGGPGGSDLGVATDLRTAYEPLMQKYQVDVAFWGHHHSYQRSCPVFNGQCVGDGTVHIVTGASGAGFSANLQPVLPAWAVYVEDDRHGYHRVYVRQNAMVLEFVDSQTRAVVDSTTIQSRFTTDRQANNHKPKHAKHPRVHAKIFEPVDGAVDVL